jgi:ApeA N-terminal domain 1
MAYEIEPQRGYFWWADEPAQNERTMPVGAVSGSLHTDGQGRSTLRLDGLLSKIPGRLVPYGTQPTDDKDYPIVGVIKGGLSYTRLEKVRLASLHHGSNMPSSQSITALTRIDGDKLITGVEQLARCTNIRISLAAFGEWLDLSPPKFRRTRKGLVSYQQGLDEHTYELKDAVLTMNADLWASTTDNLAAETRQEGYLTFRPKAPLSFEEVKQIQKRFEDLLILLTNFERVLESILVQLDDGNHWYQLTSWRPLGEQQEVTRFGCWTLFPDLAPIFGEITSLWHEKYDRVGPGFFLYLGNRRGMHLFLEDRFMNLIWGLESLHRQIGTPWDNGNVVAKVDRILGSVCKKDRAWLARNLRYATEPPLDSRIADLLGKIPIGLTGDDLTWFAKQCAELRNAMSHHGGRRDGVDYHLIQRRMYLSSVILGPLYHARILHEIGVSDDKIRDGFNGLDASMRLPLAFKELRRLSDVNQ